MAENSEDQPHKPVTAGDQNTAPTTDRTQANNNEADNRDRQHHILQQVLRILTDPIDEPPEAENGDAARRLYEQNRELRTVLSSMAGHLRDKSGQCLTLEKKVSALTAQVTSLKEVVNITKDLLNIRNMEVQHLKEDISKMELGLEAQRQQYNQTIGRLDQAFKLNSQLKEEYQTQLSLFQDLKEKYAVRAKLMETAPETNTSEAQNQQ